MPDPDNGRLDSWKEIADYLGRDVRTLLRWEKEKGLPVHTVPGGKRRTVYAFKHEIDAWLAKSPLAEEDAQAASTSGPIPWLGQRTSFAGWALLGVVLLGLAAYGAYRLKNRSPHALTQILQEGNRLVAISPNSSVAWTYEFLPGPATVIQSVVLPEGTPDGEAGVLVTVTMGERKGDVLYFFSPQGEPRWQYQSTETFAFASGEYKLSWGFSFRGPVEIDGQRKVFLITREYAWWPSQLLVLNLRGEVESRFVNSGWIHSVYTMRGPRGPLLAVGGVTNSLDGSFLAVLEARGFSASSPETPGSPYHCTNCPSGRPPKYFVFPRSELNVLTGSSLYPAAGEQVGDKIPVVRHETPGFSNEPPPSSIFEFSLEFQLTRADYDDRYWGWHRMLEKEGKLKHSREKCPERDGPPFIREWTPENGWREIRAANRTPKR